MIIQKLSDPKTEEVIKPEKPRMAVRGRNISQYYLPPSMVDSTSEVNPAVIDETISAYGIRSYDYDYIRTSSRGIRYRVTTNTSNSTAENTPEF